ncbi:alpha/beta hydrolase [Nocardia sp. NPDC051570]|uniref:alpha/beta hydrolase n=1 Tax=Nocardia sp. NPDC051570 TaxID=3364324 RepID=UPI0037B14412
MPLDPGIRALIKQVADSPSAADPLSLDEKRVAHQRLALSLAPNPPLAVGSVHDDTLAGVPVRVYRPDVIGETPAVVCCHGGSFVLSDLDTYDHVSRRLCRDANVTVIDVGFRRAPEYLYPAAYDDCLAVTRWVADHIDDYGGGKLAIAGDSAGGNLATGVAFGFRDEGRHLDAQLLAYPSTDLSGRTHYASRDISITGNVMSPVDDEIFSRIYLSSDPTAKDHAPASPLLADDFTNLPPTIIATAEFDPVRDECAAYADKLATAGVPVTLHVYAGLIHGFLNFSSVSPAIDAAITEMYTELAKLLAG